VARPGFVARAGDRQLFTRAASLARIFLLLSSRPRQLLSERAAINGKRQASDLRVGFLTSPGALRAERTRDPSERTFKAREKSASAKGKLTGEDVTPTKAGKELYEERTQEWWEGYDPGMDADF
jgi:hypothetical protein